MNDRRPATTLIRLALAGCLAVIAAILIALVAATPAPAVTAAALLAILLAAAGAGLVLAHAPMRGARQPRR